MILSKKLLKQIRAIKRHSQQGDVVPLLDLLANGVSPNDFVLLREQKVFFAIRDPQKLKAALDEFGLVTACVTDEKLRFEYAMYRQFVLSACSSITHLSQTCQPLLASVRRLSLEELMRVSDKITRKLTVELASRYSRRYRFELEDTSASTEDRSDSYATYLQALSGQCKDVVFASARVLNEASRECTLEVKGRHCGKRATHQATRDFEKLVFIASELNSIDYAVDKISFGEWNIREIDLTCEPPRVYFDEVDLRLAKARTLGLRRQIVWFHHLPKSHRLSRDYLKSRIGRFIWSAIREYDDYLNTSGEDVVSEVTNTISLQLNYVGAEDDLLFAVAPEVAIHYLAAIALRCYREVGNYVAERLSARKRKIARRPSLSLSSIADAMFPSDSGKRREFQDALNKQVLSLPASGHLELTAKPFFRIQGNCVYSSSTLETSAWVDSIRQSSVSGGKRTNEFGRMWESFVASSFRDNGWIVRGEGIKIKRDKRVLTDIDIVTSREGVLLVLQIKAFARGGGNVYEQWLSRQQIVKGAEQALLCVQELDRNPQLRSRLHPERIKLIQPVVLTNSPIFGGWVSNGVPVIGIGDLMSILRGAKVTFHTPKNVVGKTSLINAEHANAEEFLRLLFEPVSWCIANETDEIEHFHAATGELDLFFPRLTRTCLPLNNQLMAN